MKIYFQTPLTTLLRHALLIAITFCSTGGCGGDDKAQAPVAPLEVKARKLAKSDVPKSVEYVGQTEGAVDAEIRARVEGVVLSMGFEEGKEVQEGQLLYTIDPAPYQAKVAQAQGTVAEAQTALVKAESDLKRVRPLVQMKALSERDLDTAVAAHGSAMGGLKAAEAVLESAKIELSYCEIRSPVRGVIGLTKAKVGEFVGRAPNPIVLNTVSNLDSIRVKFAISEKDYLYFSRLRQKQIDAGEPASKRSLDLVLADGSVYPLKGEVTSLGLAIDPKTGTFPIEASFPNPNKLIRPGQFAKVRSVAETITGAILVPKSALREMQGQFQAFAIKPDNTIESRNIKVGQVVGEEQIVEAGLAEGDVVAIDNLQRLRSGMAVSPKF